VSAKPKPEISDLTRPFWDAVQNDELHLQRCTACSTWIFYPNAWCTACYATELEWAPCSGRGTVWSYSVVYQAPYAAFERDVPYVLATIRLDEGPQMMTNLVNCPPEMVEVGMPVRFTVETRSGGFKVPQFEPVR
jgi:uncharacterized protein